MQQPRKRRYRLYVDESGDHSYGNLKDSAYRYLALLGVWFDQGDEYVKFADSLENLKRAVFGARPDEPIHLHRKDVVCRTGAFGILNDRATRQRFDDGLIEVTDQSQFRMTCVVIDKMKHLSTYGDAAFHPYHYCLAALLDRYCGWLNYKNAVGDVMAESRGGSADRQLKEAYQRVHHGGTLMFFPPFHSSVLTTKDLKLKAKAANIAGLQLADVLAHPMKNYVLSKKGVGTALRGAFVANLINVAKRSLNRNEATGVVAGYGYAWL